MKLVMQEVRSVDCCHMQVELEEMVKQEVMSVDCSCNKVDLKRKVSWVAMLTGYHNNIILIVSLVMQEGRATD